MWGDLWGDLWGRTILWSYATYGDLSKRNNDAENVTFAKLRFLRGVRVIYVDVVLGETIFLLYAYPKSVKDDLSQSEISDIHKAVTILKS